MKIIINGQAVEVGGGGGNTLTAGRGIEIETTEADAENEAQTTISVETPIVTISKDEYDALSDEEKASDVVYAVIDESQPYWAQVPVMRAVTLPQADWDAESLTITVEVEGVAEDGSKQLVMPTPAEDYQGAYYEAGILCIGHAADSLTFSANELPETDIIVNVTLMEVANGNI